MPAHFSEQTFEFLRELAQNNRRDWFQANKSRYIEQVRDPFLRFIDDFNPRLAAISSHYHGEVKANGGALFRIYRDTRFSRDKTPYKTSSGARWTHREGGRGQAPLFYLHLQPGQVFMAAGCWHPDSAMLASIRNFIDNNPRAWTACTRDPKFRKTFHMGGDRLKRMPRGFESEHPLAEDLKRKDYVVVSELTEAQAISPRFMGLFERRCRAASGFVDYLCAALDLEF